MHSKCAVALVAGVGLYWGLVWSANAVEPLAIGSRLELLVDDFLIASLDGKAESREGVLRAGCGLDCFGSLHT